MPDADVNYIVTGCRVFRSNLYNTETLFGTYKLVINSSSWTSSKCAMNDRMVLEWATTVIVLSSGGYGNPSFHQTRPARLHLPNNPIPDLDNLLSFLLMELAEADNIRLFGGYRRCLTVQQTPPIMDRFFATLSQYVRVVLILARRSFRCQSLRILVVLHFSYSWLPYLPAFGTPEKKQERFISANRSGFDVYIRAESCDRQVV